MTTPVPRANILHEIHLMLVDRVKEASNGQFIIEDFAADELYGATEILDNVAAGVNEFAATYAGYFEGKSYAFMAKDSCADPIESYELRMVLFTDPDWQSGYQALWERFGVKLAGYFMGGPRDTLCWTDSMPMTVEELAGKKIRTNGPGVQMFEQFGAEGVFLAGGELYTAMQLGTIDCCEYADWQSNWNLGLQEVTKYVQLYSAHAGGAAVGGGDYIVNPDAWAALPDHLKQLLTDEILAGYSLVSGRQWHETFEYKAKWYEYPGIEFFNVPQLMLDQLADAAEKDMDGYSADNPEYGKLIQAKRAVAVKMGIWRDNWANDPVLMAIPH
jgi:TRAP-type mannitol/chloroaromatic compound transport system substrate-binding protein